MPPHISAPRDKKTAPGRRTSAATISAILPAYNEVENIIPAVEALAMVLSDIAPEWEIVVVDDGSRDDTIKLVKELSRDKTQVKLASHPENRGYGAALKTGINLARHQLLFMMDADLQFDPGELLTLLPWTNRFDIVIGYRKRRQEHLGRRFNAWCWGVLIRGLFGLRVRDVNCAFKLFNRRVFEQISIRSQGAMAYSEILILAQKHGFTVKQVPVTHYPRKRGRQSGARLKTIYRAFLDLAKLYANLKG